MSLYVRLYTDFWSHRKTMKLRSLIGDDALWLPIRLWSYAAEHQLDGCFKEYSPEVLAMLLGYSKDAQAMLQALHQSGFMEDNCIHDWDQHNGFHSKFSQRAKKAAESRWKKEKKQKKEEKIEMETETETSIATSTACRMLQASEVVEAWNALGDPFGKVMKVSGEREKMLKARIKETWWVENFRSGLEKVKNSRFFHGENDRGWVCTFEFFVRPDSLSKILEGVYNRVKQNGSSGNQSSTSALPKLDTSRAEEWFSEAYRGKKWAGWQLLDTDQKNEYRRWLKSQQEVAA